MKNSNSSMDFFKNKSTEMERRSFEKPISSQISAEAREI
jgi:hypothetical protein